MKILRYGGRLISTGEYTTTQFFVVFIGVIFSGEAAAQFFSYTTSLTKSTTAANYIFWLRRLKPAVQEDPGKPPFEHEKYKGPAHIEVKDVAFAYESRPRSKVLQHVNIDVSPNTLSRSTRCVLIFFQVQSSKFIALVGASGCGK
jgi:ATP-binding cassette subfamily B (MDR/TAP) protein 1